jgi:hypothetical protein
VSDLKTGLRSRRRDGPLQRVGDWAAGARTLELSSLWPIHASRDLAVESLGTAGAGKSALPGSDTALFGIVEKKARGRLQMMESGPRTVLGLATETFAPNTSSDNSSQRPPNSLRRAGAASSASTSP